MCGRRAASDKRENWPDGQNGTERPAGRKQKSAHRAQGHPRSSWPDPGAYDAKAMALAKQFQENFVQFADCEPAMVAGARPQTYGGKP